MHKDGPLFDLHRENGTGGDYMVGNALEHLSSQGFDRGTIYLNLEKMFVAEGNVRSYHGE
jgi:hypothetical protein